MKVDVYVLWAKPYDVFLPSVIRLADLPEKLRLGADCQVRFPSLSNLLMTPKTPPRHARIYPKSVGLAIFMDFCCSYYDRHFRHLSKRFVRRASLL